MVAGGSLVLTPAQRSLVEKSRAVKQQRAEALAAQQELEARTRAHVQEIKARCQSSQHTPAARRLLLRHVGQELARVAHKERHVLSKARSAPHRQDNNNREAPGGSSSSDEDAHQQQQSQLSDDGYDEERFGPVRRPPRKQPPNLWVPVRLPGVVFCVIPAAY
jgi:hypothetical protein